MDSYMLIFGWIIAILRTLLPPLLFAFGTVLVYWLGKALYPPLGAVPVIIVMVILSLVMVAFTIIAVGNIIERLRNPTKNENHPYPRDNFEMPWLDIFGDCVIVGVAFYELHRLLWLIR